MLKDPIEHATSYIMSQPAVVPISPSTAGRGHPTEVCGMCKRQKFLLTDKAIEPCPKCSTAEFRLDWQAKEAARAD